VRSAKLFRAKPLCSPAFAASDAAAGLFLFVLHEKITCHLLHLSKLNVFVPFLHKWFLFIMHKLNIGCLCILP